MPVFSFAESLAAGDTNTNIMAGSKFEFLKRPTALQIWAVADLGDLAQMDLSLGNVVVAEDIVIPQFTAALGPNTNEHLIIEGAGVGDDRIQIRVVETGGAAAAVYRVRVKLIELA